jgi:signal transduction histidine kinase
MQCGPFAKPSLNESFILALAFVISTAILSLALSADVAVRGRIEDERSTLAHDLHDGILQSLTAATLRLKACSNNCEGETRHELDLIQELLAAEQRRIRDSVCGQKNANEDFGLAKACGSVLAELSAYWRCETALRVVPSDARVSSAMAKNLWLILAEAVANAAKHGGATRVLVDLQRTPEDFVISLSDNGCGFLGLIGTYTGESLIARHAGPRFLCDRIRALRGSLTLSTSPVGARLQIRLPVE